MSADKAQSLLFHLLRNFSWDFFIALKLYGAEFITRILSGQIMMILWIKLF